MSEEKYTQEDFKDMSRVQIRKTAVQVLQISNKEAADIRSEELIAKILEAQKGGKKGKAAAKDRPAPKSKEPDPPEDEVKAAEDEEDEKPAKGRPSNGASDGAAILKAIHAVGKSNDDLETKLDTLLANQEELERKLYMALGLLSDVYKFTGEPDELDDRKIELNKEWEERAEGDDEGND